MNAERAEVIALKALGWLAGNEELCPLFLGVSGGSADDMRVRATDPAFQAAILEFITMDDAWGAAFCDTADLQYEEPLQARYALPGAEPVHWT